VSQFHHSERWALTKSDKNSEGNPLGEAEVNELNPVLNRAFFAADKCISGEAIESVYAIFAPEDGPNMNFCLRGYNITGCEDTNLVVNHQWDVACAS